MFVLNETKVDNVMDTTRCTITSDYHSLTREAVVKLLEQRDAELKNKDAELERKSRRILELAPTCFIFRSQRNVINHAPTHICCYSNGTTSAVALLLTIR